MSAEITACPLLIDHQSADATRPTVAVVLCTYNGERFLGAQISSLLRQSWPVSVMGLDDRSTDSSLELLDRRLSPPQHFSHRQPVNQGFVGNFESGICQAIDAGFDYIALSDQDDLWEPDRVASGMRAMLTREREAGSDLPLLWHSDLSMIDGTGKVLADSYLQHRHYRIDAQRNAARIMGQCGVMGNTILLNRSLARLALPFPAGLPVHDYWLALLAELMGERLFEARSLVRYRLHDSNASNTHASLFPGSFLRRAAQQIKRCALLDLRLPYKEDSRKVAVDTLLNSERYNRSLDNAQRRLLAVFADYLRARRPGVVLAVRMLHLGFIDLPWSRRLRFLFVSIVTRRY